MYSSLSLLQTNVSLIAHSAPVQHEPSNKWTLHLDDDLDILSYIKTLFYNIADITSVYKTQEFSHLLTDNIYDIFILDLVLEDGSGSSMARIRKELYTETPIIMLSDRDFAYNIEEADAIVIKSHFVEEESIKPLKHC